MERTSGAIQQRFQIHIGMHAGAKPDRMYSVRSDKSVVALAANLAVLVLTPIIQLDIAFIGAASTISVIVPRIHRSAEESARARLGNRHRF